MKQQRKKKKERQTHIQLVLEGPDILTDSLEPKGLGRSLEGTLVRGLEGLGLHDRLRGDGVAHLLLVHGQRGLQGLGSLDFDHRIPRRANGGHAAGVDGLHIRPGQLGENLEEKQPK